MSLSAGECLGAYEILSALGAGGMGEIYKARDTRLNRIVAIKVLHASLATDPQFRERFDREARTISSLDHPHICTLHDVGEHCGTSFLVMQYLEGETLEQRLKKGALPLDQALEYAVQIAEALDKAHRAGIVHRDLKPGNVMLTKSGAKLLDFGLAKTTGGAGVAAELSMLPTTPPNLTAQGTILGTFQYMAPEQLEGQEADARTDIFAFGAVVYEMVTGNKAFEGKSQASLIGAILKDSPPPVTRLQPLAPAVLDRFIDKCLAKDWDKRWQSVYDMAVQLRWMAAEIGAQDGAGVAGLRARPERLWMTIAGALLIVCIAAVIVAVTRVGPVPPDATSMRFTIPAPADVATDSGAVLSPDGRRIAFTGTSEGNRVLWVRSLDALTAQPIPGTEGIALGSIPFWSPDSKAIGFFAQDTLKTVEPGGGPPQVLCEAGIARGGTWSRNGTIVFAPNTSSVLYRVPAAGGVPAPVTTFDASRNERSHRWPWFLPDGNHFLYLARSATPEQGGIYVGQLDFPHVVRLADGASGAQFAPPDLVLFWRAGTLMAQQLDTRALRLTGAPLVVAQQVAFSDISSRAYFSVSQTGALAYRHAGNAQTQLTWVDRSGAAIGTIGSPGRYWSVSLSPDQRKAALALNDGQGGSDIWIADLTRGVLSRFTFDRGRNLFPVWSPDGAQIVFAVQHPDVSGQLYRKNSDASGLAEPLVFGDDTAKFPTDWSRDGKFVVYHSFNATTQSDIWIAPTGGGKPAPLVQTPFLESSGRLSPDGRWIAYSSDESGQLQVYVQSFPPGRGKWRISTAGGRTPEWRPDGRELYFMDQRGKLLATPVRAAASFDAGVPMPLFDLHAPPNEYPVPVPYAVAAGGQKFLVSRLIDEEPFTPVVLLLNWTAGLKK